MSDDDFKSDELSIPGVVLTIFMRDGEAAAYEKALGPEETEIVNARDTIGWVFPDGSASLDRVVVDGKEFTGDELNSTAMIDTGVKEGSRIEVYKTCFPQDDNDEEPDA